MGLPMVNRCCGCVSLERGGFILATLALAVCIADIAIGAAKLPNNEARAPEDNLISMSMVMFATLSAICNLLLLAGIFMRRPGYLQVALLFNSLFVLFNFMVATVTCLFSPEFKSILSPTVIALTTIGMIVGFIFTAYYFLVLNSLYRKMKMTYGDSAIPV